MKTKTFSDKLFQAIVMMALIAIVVICVYPIIYVASMSISDPMKIAAEPVLLLPRGFSLKAMTVLFQSNDIWVGYLNTIFYTVFGTLINIVLTVLLAYPLALKKFSGKKFLTGFITFTMLFSGGLIPTYILVNNLGLYNTRLALLLPTAISVFNVIIARSFFQGLPDSMAESAKMDGANDLVILLYIILPISKAILATLLIYYAVGHWNSYLNAILYLSDKALQPLQVFLQKILITNDPSLSQGVEMGLDKMFIGEQLKYACIIVSILPIMCVYPFFQKYFAKGVALGAVKG